VKQVFTKNPDDLTKSIVTEINGLAGQIVKCNYELLMLVGLAPEEIREYFRAKNSARIKERVEDSIFRSHIATKDFAISEDNDSRELYKAMVQKRRSDVYKEMLGKLPVEDLSNLTHDTTPVMIEEIFTLQSSGMKDQSKVSKSRSKRE
jgi:hypothetical protein